MMNATLPNTLRDLDLDAEAYHHFLTEQQPVLYNRNEIPICGERIALLRSEIELRRLEKQSAGQHESSMAQGSNILHWTKLAVLAAVAVPILVALFPEIRLSKIQRAMSSGSRRSKGTTNPAIASSATPQTTLTPPSLAPIASPTPEETTTPTATPMKWPPPAP